MAIFALTTEEGGRTLAHGALVVDPRRAMDPKEAREVSEAYATDPKALHGKFLGWTRIMEESDYVLSDEGQKVQERLWVSCSFSSHRDPILMGCDRTRQWRSLARLTVAWKG